MNLDNAVEQIMSRVKELGTGTRFSYEKVNQWLDLSSGDDLMWAYDKLSDRLTNENTIYIELKKDYVITVKPEGSDMAASDRRNGINRNSSQ
jgi:hypothetical protein